MRKRRRLADKLTISVCAVLVAVSAFFYAPMDVSATSGIGRSLTLDSPTVVSGNDIGHLDVSGSYDNYNFHYYDGYVELGHINFGSSFDNDKVYKVSMYTRLDTHLGTLGLVRAVDIFQPLDEFGYKTSEVLLNFRVPDNNTGYGNDFYSELTSEYYFTGDFLNNNDLSMTFVCLVSKSMAQLSKIDVTFNFQYVVYSIEELTDDESSQYQNGYDAGYSAGEQVGYGNGYSNGFADGEASVDTDAIYDEAFQAGKDSVDTDSYYDAGYQAGYNVAYQEGYESGYDEGYQSAMDRIDGWGADTNDYPLLVFDDSLSDFSFLVHCQSNVPSTCYGYLPLFDLDFEINSAHTYKLVFDSDGFYNSAHNCRFSTSDLGFVVGDSRFSISAGSGTYEFYLPGDVFASSVILDSYVYGMAYYDSSANSSDLEFKTGQVTVGIHGDVSLMVYDMGPSGDTQNHIANQTDSLTNGFDNSQGNTVNSDLSSGLNEYQTSEDTLWATATTGLKDFTFFDFASVPAMITGMSFITAIMGSWFNQAGGASGVGIVLSILFSVILVAMVLGLYRWYQSRGGKE